MSAADLEDFYVHTVDVDTVTGGGSWGTTTVTHTGVPCFIDESRRLVRDEQGNEVISETTITAAPVHADKFAHGSVVHLPRRDATVLTVSVADSGPLDLPDHVEVAVT